MTGPVTTSASNLNFISLATDLVDEGWKATSAQGIPSAHSWLSPVSVLD